MKSPVVSFLTVLCTTAVGVWAAAFLVVGFQVDGSLLEQLLAVLIAAVVVTAATEGATALAGRGLARLRARLFHQLDEQSGADLLGLSKREFFAPVYRTWLLGGVGFAIQLVVVVALIPAVLWVGVSIGSAVGLPVELSGFWPVVVAGLVTYAMRRPVTVLVSVLAWRLRGWRAVRALVRLLLPLAGLALAVALLGGVRLDAAPVAAQALTLLALAMLFSMAEFWLSVPFITTIARVVGNTLKLWLVSWLSGWMDVSLRVDGFWMLVLAGLIITVVNWFARLAEEPESRPRNTLTADPFWPPPTYSAPISIPY